MIDIKQPNKRKNDRTRILPQRPKRNKARKELLNISTSHLNNKIHPGLIEG
jgi:hypothetical protein